MDESASSSLAVAEDAQRRPKLAERLARELALAISRDVLPEGHALGSEAELARRLDASRWTVREALGILESEGLISVRRGRNGGIFVAAPSDATISTAIRSYLEFIRVDVPEIIEVRRLLDEAVLERALARIEPRDIPRLRMAHDLDADRRGVVQDFIRYNVLLDVARSPVLQAFVRAVGELGISAILRSTLSDEALQANVRAVRLKRREQIEAIIAGRLGAALALESSLLEMTAELLESARPSEGASSAATRLRALHLLSASGQLKRPQLLMQEIASDIVARGWPVGEHLGTESELLAHYRVSRSTFREAIRTLEQIGVVEMRSGRQFGLKIGSPNPETVVANSRSQFARLGVSSEAYCEAFDAVGAAAAGFAAERNRGRTRFAASAAGSPSAFFNEVGEKSGNRIVALLIRILIGQDSAPCAKREALSDPLPLGELAAAIDAGDTVLARRLILSLNRYGS